MPRTAEPAINIVLKKGESASKSAPDWVLAALEALFS